MKQFKGLNETFDDPGVPKEMVVYTKKSLVCRFIYDDEDEKR